MKKILFSLQVEIPVSRIRATMTDDAIIRTPSRLDVARLVRDDLQRRLSETGPATVKLVGNLRGQ